MKDATAGDPITGLKWSHKSLRKISRTLRRRRCRLSPPTAGKLLKQTGYSLRVNAKRLAGRKAAQRDRQFAYLVRQRHLFLDRGWPVISVDSKKRELVGPFKNAGRAWRPFARAVNMYDFPSDALGIAVLYGVYDVGRNEGFMGVGISHDTPEFAVATIRTWWFQMGQRAYPGVRHLLICCRAGWMMARETRWVMAISKVRGSDQRDDGERRPERRQVGGDRSDSMACAIRSRSTRRRFFRAASSSAQEAKRSMSRRAPSVAW